LTLILLRDGETGGESLSGVKLRSIPFRGLLVRTYTVALMLLRVDKAVFTLALSWNAACVVLSLGKRESAYGLLEFRVYSSSPDIL
jgi:hypothetical protein